MNRLRTLWRELFDIRPGEHLRTWAMFFYLLCVLFAYYILKPVSRSMFLNKFDIDKLPSLYIVIAIPGGVLAYLYSKLAAKTSLRVAVFWTMSLSVACLAAIWAAIHLSWMIYVLNIFVSMFSICLVSQGWLVASNLFDAREAKRLYPLLGMGMVLGAAFGGEFTSRTALLVGTRNLLLASAGMVILAYIAFRVAASQSHAALAGARGAEKAETDFSFTGMIGDIFRTRHLQVIVAIMVMMYLVDTMVEYQFQVMAAAGHKGDQLTAFFGKFYGLYLNLAEFVFQLFLTAAVVRRFGVGGTLQIAPVTIMLASAGTSAAPGVATAGAVRLAEATTRYTLNRTGMELLYMPLPKELRNRIKAFIDICVDRLSRGLAGLILLFLTASVFDLDVKGIAVVVMCLCVPWIYFSHLARREYIATIRKRMESRRLDLESARVAVTDRATIQLLESAAAADNPRQAAYALGLLAGARDYDPRPLLRRLAVHPAREVREKVFEIATARRDDSVLEFAMQEIRRAQAGGGFDLARSAVAYALSISPDRARLAAELLDDRNPDLVEGALEALRSDREMAQDLITREWLDHNALSGDPRRRALAACALGVRGDAGSEWLYRLLDDPDPHTRIAAIRSAGQLHNRAYLHALVEALGNARLRGDAIEALVAYGESICGFLSDVLLDESVAARVRRQIPRVLKNIPRQRSVDVLLHAVGSQDLSIRASVLKALNRLREAAPSLNFENTFVTGQILNEARYYYELNAALAPFRERHDGAGSAARLLARTIEQRLRDTLERLFRLLGLRYPPKEIYSAYLAVSKSQGEEHTAALEFLDNTIDRNLKRVLLPLMDGPEHVLERGRDLFGLDPRTPEDAIRDLIRSRDPWLTACAMAAAAELKLRSLAPEIATAAAEARGDVYEVARSAEAALAA
ncbi:MAG TPA: Npt1/Npt2 family nucleotide transporter [Bryobacteraceae bacterium]|jgi:ATP/ADP translocase